MSISVLEKISEYATSRSFALACRSMGHWDMPDKSNFSKIQSTFSELDCGCLSSELGLCVLFGFALFVCCEFSMSFSSFDTLIA